MTLPASGAISLANVNVELGLASTTTISLNQTNVRTLAGKASGTISMSDLLGKSNVSFSPAGGTSSGTAVALSNSGGPGSVSVTITCSQAATWVVSRSGSSTGANYPSGTYTSLTSVTFTLSNSTSTPRSTSWTVNATAGGITRYWTVQIDNTGTA